MSDDLAALYLTRRADELETPTGYIEAGLHPNDAALVAAELRRCATAIRKGRHIPKRGRVH
ncbi:MAG: hypothetical protein U9R73_00675 [Pseudomonadota bacterium]|nr:hypothetical protein [Pseudomonadota bacterium]